MTTEQVPTPLCENCEGEYLECSACGVRVDYVTVDASLIATATRLGFELGKAEGRKQAGEEIAVAIEGVIDGYLDPRDDINGDRAAAIAREIGSRPQEGDKS